jgi:uncharacterized membrane protein YkvI
MAIDSSRTAQASWFKRILLPGFTFKAVVIGGGYSTGRELAEFFMPSGPWDGVAGMLLAMAIWSVLCVVTYLFAQVMHALDQRTFFQKLLGLFAILFELSYFLYIVVILAVYGAAAGASGTGAVHAVNERLASAYRSRQGRDLKKSLRFIAAGVLLVGSIFIANRFGLVPLIAKGYRALSYTMIALYVLPVLTYGVWQLARISRREPPAIYREAESP